MKRACVLLLGLLSTIPGPGAAASAKTSAPVHIALRAASTVQADADGFFTLGAVADLTAGDAASRDRIAAVRVGRAPLPGETRRLTRGDLALKLRQAGLNPDRQAVLEGVPQATISVSAASAPGAGRAGENAARSRPEGGSSSPAGTAGQTLVHRGDSVTIVVQDGGLTITAQGIAREAGGQGDTIRVHREGVMADLTVTVLDAQTVQLEM